MIKPVSIVRPARGAERPLFPSWPRVWRLGWRVLCGWLGLEALQGPALAAEGPFGSAGSTAFFENRIRPLLAEHCFECHSARVEKPSAGLRLDTAEGMLRGGVHGPVVIPGDPGRSQLLERVHSTDPKQRMPRKQASLSKRQLADLTAWIQQGAVWTQSGEGGLAPTSASIAGTSPTSEEGRTWWAFQPVRRPVHPPVQRPAWSANPIDAFVLAELEGKGLQPNRMATRRELIRRAYFDLLGVPPSPEAVAAFEADASPHAWDRLIDQLLAQPQYGERWGRHWLDLVRFAQSNGYERDGEKPYSWRYRDYVVRAFNADKPYDQFIREQLAGDELDTVTPDSLIATGYQRLGVCDDEPDDKRMAEFDELDDILSTTGATFLGVTLGCARCHDHKFDPIPHADYYRMLAFFRNLRLNEPPKYTLDSANYLPLAEPEQIRSWKEAHEGRVEAAKAALKDAPDESEKKRLTERLAAVQSEAPPFEFTLGVRERGLNPPPTHVLLRGNAGKPGPEVTPGFLRALGGGERATVPACADRNSSGRRRELAAWIASPENPLTARVMVNRVWQHHFGRGLVKTTSDFGRAGVPPTHPRLLDWLASEFVVRGWSLKALHKLILQSQTYQLSSQAENPQALATDPGNDLYWRQNLRRLEAEALRDTLLTVSGQLNRQMGGRGFFPRLSGEVLAGQSRPGMDWELSPSTELSRRSLYAFVRRTMSVPMLEVFDYSNTAAPLSERPVTTVAPQSLLLLNDEFMQQQAVALAGRLRREVARSEAPAWVERGFQLAVGRLPTPRERQLSMEFLQRQGVAFAALESRLTFKPDAPSALYEGYFNQLPPHRFLVGPAVGWSYCRGSWAPAYEGIRSVDRDRGPAALCDAETFDDGEMRGSVRLSEAAESIGFLLRSNVQGDEVRGYELALDVRAQVVRLRRHAATVTTLAERSIALPKGQAFDLRFQAVGAKLSAWIGDGDRGGDINPVTPNRPAFLETVDSQPLTAPGKAGLRAAGAAVNVDRLIVAPVDRTSRMLRDELAPSAEEQALRSFCLLLLNLNEVVYID